MAQSKLSAVVITFNEEKNIGRCLSSILPVVDEIIVMDACSTDNTVSIVSEFRGATLVSQPWKGFSEAKNDANRLASGDYILSIDADEELSAELQQEIQKLRSSGFGDAVYELNRLTNYCGKWIRHSGWYPEYKTRIFPRDASTWKGTLHEELILVEKKSTLKLKGNLLHYSYPTIYFHLKKMISYTELAVRKDIEAGKKYNILTHGILKPMFVFFKKFLFQAGFLDGYYGFVIAVNSAYERFLRYSKYRELQAQKNPENGAIKI